MHPSCFICKKKMVCISCFLWKSADTVLRGHSVIDQILAVYLLVPSRVKRLFIRHLQLVFLQLIVCIDGSVCTWLLTFYKMGLYVWPYFWAFTLWNEHGLTQIEPDWRLVWTLTIRVDKGKSQPHSRGGLKQIEADWLNPLCSVNPLNPGWQGLSVFVL